MKPTIHEISRGDRGIRQTLARMIELADGEKSTFWRVLAEGIAPRAFDSWLRARWLYVPDVQEGVPTETLRTLTELERCFVDTGKFQGDCDDAAIAAAAYLKLRNRNFQAAALVAVRPPDDPDFTAGHVFCIAMDSAGIFRVDPTAPADADYSGWEKMVVNFGVN